MSWLTDCCHKERVINCQQAPWPEDDVTPLRPLYTFVWSTADPAWLLHNISVYKSRPWKIKNWDQFLEILVSPCRSLSQILAESPSGAWNPPCLLIMPGLLRSDRGGLSVSSPSGQRKDACSLCKWCKLLSWSFIGLPCKPSYSASFLHWIFLLSYPHAITLYISN